MSNATKLPAYLPMSLKRALESQELAFRLSDESIRVVRQLVEKSEAKPIFEHLKGFHLKEGEWVTYLSIISKAKLFTNDRDTHSYHKNLMQIAYNLLALLQEYDEFKGFKLPEIESFLEDSPIFEELRTLVDLIGVIERPEDKFAGKVKKFWFDGMEKPIELAEEEELLIEGTLFGMGYQPLHNLQAQLEELRGKAQTTYKLNSDLGPTPSKRPQPAVEFLRIFFDGLYRAFPERAAVENKPRTGRLISDKGASRLPWLPTGEMKTLLEIIFPGCQVDSAQITSEEEKARKRLTD